ncbi:unnamed protein product [Prunus brigantina]
MTKPQAGGKNVKICFQRGAQVRAGSGTHEDGLARRPVSPELEPEFWVDFIADARLASAHSFDFFFYCHVASSGLSNRIFSSNPTASNFFLIKY